MPNKTKKTKVYKSTPPSPKQTGYGKQLREYRKRLKQFGKRV